MKKITNPFYTIGYKSEYCFCDRKIELKRLYSNINNLINTTLISEKKYRKPTFTYRLFEDLNKGKECICIFIDIDFTQNLKKITELLTPVILSMLPKKQNKGKHIFEFLNGLRPVNSYDVFAGKPEVRFDYSQTRRFERTLEAILRFLDVQKSPTLVTIDEFQQVVLYPKKNTEAFLHTIIQTRHNVEFIFNESNQYLMTEVFNSSKRPFFSSSKSLYTYTYPKHLPTFIQSLLYCILRKPNEQLMQIQLIFSLEGYAGIFITPNLYVTNCTGATFIFLIISDNK